jgi:hypothetical protein
VNVCHEGLSKPSPRARTAGLLCWACKRIGAMLHWKCCLSVKSHSIKLSAITPWAENGRQLIRL